MKPRYALSVVTLLVVLLVAGVVFPGGQAGAAARSSGADVALAAIQPNLYRRAAQHLEDMRGSKMAPTWAAARLGSQIRPLYRPGIQGVAYYEFPVLNQTGAAAGYIIISTGTHDFPIAHWDYKGLTPSQKLARAAAAQHKQAVRFYKLDTLTYSAEDATGAQVATTNTHLDRLSGQDPAQLDKPIAVTTETWSPTSDTDQAAGTHTVTRSGPSPNKAIKLTAWTSWAQLKANFAQSYQTMIQSLARQADHDWQIERSAVQKGEGLRTGTCRVLALVAADPQITKSGVGAARVSAVVRQRTGLLPVIDLCVSKTAAQQTQLVNLTISYPDGRSEVLHFAVLSPTDQGPQSAASRAPGTMAMASAQARSSWSAWTYYWAGTSGQQRLYDQMTAGTYVNTSSCYSGCGATAWSMLFGWADYQASIGNATWTPRWGIYRQNGGTGSDAVAPQYWDTGVRNMMWEIRNDIGTFCIGTSGATYPWDMDQAASYLNGRTGTTLSTHYNSVGLYEDRLREYARNSIRDRHTPAIIGTGWLEHYPLAWGYAWQSRTVNILGWQSTEYNRSFYVNEGWGGSGDGWVTASTWFSGEIYP